MAYNPFNIFRRNQKVIFAVITVFIMFTFVLSSGLGGGADFFEWFPQWLGNSRAKGDHLCTIDGKKVYDKDVSVLRRQRIIANRYMFLAAGTTANKLNEYARAQLSTEGAKRLQAIVNAPDAQRGIRAMADDEKATEGDRAAARAFLALSAIQSMVGQGDGHYFATAPNRTSRDLVNFMLWEKKADQLGIKLTEDDVKALIQKDFF